MDSLFDDLQSRAFEPLAVRMRPTSLDDFYGQDKAVGKGSFLRAMLDQDTIPSMLFYGPSGTGKTTLAGIIAAMSHSRFVQLNATNTGISDLRSSKRPKNISGLFNSGLSFSWMKYTVLIRGNKMSFYLV